MAKTPVEDIEVEFNLDRLKIRDIEAIEDAMDELGIEGGFEDLFPADGKRVAKGMRVVAYALARRDHPDLTLEEAGDIVVKMNGAEQTPLANGS